ncbi:hypothetical protein CJ195_27085 [Bacillus sp. UMB0899]|uniref:response regulator transcription factor n=1 Tax=Metabacillus schmidteae TaxID=2730405 RepID=UPI000C8033B9|nr:response regulator [Metabacillus schmidteae]PMC33725.1 hypothetical protein CJ195_27085 [Bacillus sp. UMB0899]
MYRILIADDEKDERNVIRFLLNKYRFQLDIIEASNGKEALAQLEKQPVNILFTDVKMPFIDGIELATKARELYPNIQTIFFSGHNDFDYIKKALSLRAIDYILKPIKPNEFQQTVSSVLQNIKTQEKELAQIEANTELIKTHILNRLINKTPLEKLKNEYPSIDFDFLSDYSHMILMQFAEPFFDRLPQEKDTLFFYQQIEKAITNFSCDFIDLNPFQILLLVKINGESSMHTEQIATRIQKQIHKEYGINCFTSTSKKFSSPSEMPSFYEELEKDIEDRFFYSDTYVYPKEEAAPIEDKGYPEADDDLLHDIKNAVIFGDIVSFKQNMNLLFEKYRLNLEISHIYVRFLFSKLLQMLVYDLPLYDKRTINKKLEAIYSCPHFSDIEKILTSVQNEIIKKLEDERKSPKHVIQIVKKYIHKHYQEDLSLNLLSEQVYLSPGYLSEIFIQETGCGINKYIKNLRMEIAKDLLHSTNMKVNDICKNVGYQNLSYFVRSFREHFGASPEKYRQMDRKKKENS